MKPTTQIRRRLSAPPTGRTATPANAVGSPIGWVRDERGSLLLAAMVWLLVAYLVIPSSYYSGQQIDFADMAEPNPTSRAIKLALLGLSSIIVIWRGSLGWLVIRRLNPFFTAFLALVPVSVVWSIAPTETLARYVSLVSIVLVCFAFVLVSWRPTRFQDVVRPIFTLLLIASIVFALASPRLGIETGTGTLQDAWRGLTSQKNQFGMLSSFGFLFWLHAGLSREVRWWHALLGVSLAGACILLSRSSTSLLASVLAGTFMLLLLRSPANWRPYMPYIVGVFAIIVVVFAVAVLKLVPGLQILLTPITAITGKDLTFSNRSEIWAIIKEHIELRPLLGSGYGAYWIGPVPTSPSYIFLSRMYFYPTESHNGYLEIVNDLGLVGLSILFGYLVVFVRQALQLMKLNRTQGALFLSLFFQQAINNLSETSWLSVTDLMAFTVMTLATFALSRSLLDYRLREILARLGEESGSVGGASCARRRPAFVVTVTITFVGACDTLTDRG